MTDTLVLTNAILKDLMTDALVMREYAGNFDTCLSAGAYGVTPAEASNIPLGANQYGVLIVVRSCNYGVQTFIQRGSPTKISVRTFITRAGMEPDFSPWSTVQTALAS